MTIKTDMMHIGEKSLGKQPTINLKQNGNQDKFFHSRLFKHTILLQFKIKFTQLKQKLFNIISMQKYKLGKALGDGSFGSVIKAINQKTKQIVAIKHMKQKYTNWDQCISLNQIKVLKKLHHPNIVKLYEVIKDNNQLYFVFQFMEKNVFELMMQRKLQHLEIRNIIFQTLQALNYMHRHGFFHRDLKPQNLLQMHGTVKIADFGLARDIRAKPPFTQYVSTRWYRAPQVLLRSRNYNSPMDMFAIGAILAQLYRNSPLFPGMSQKDQINKILNIMGTPSKQDWPNGYQLAASIGLQMPQYSKKDLREIITTAPPDAIDLIESMLQVNPQKRPTAFQCLQHPYFKVKSTGNQPVEQILTKFQNFGLSNNFKQQNDSEEDDWIENAKYKAGYICSLKK